jgi:1,2-dihydroxy-3-keto-5-methylthiopentene dioxygenase
MSALSIYDDNGQPLEAVIRDHAAIAARLAEHGVQYEQWQATAALTEAAEQEEVLQAYRPAIDKLNEDYGFQSVDVVALRPDNPQKAEFRQKFLAEHTHGDFEVRFFVDGSGLFYLHLGDKVYVVLCEKGDLISVPANTTHWFDMGKDPNFKCIRLFTTEEGWLGDFTGSDIASRFPDYDSYVAELAQAGPA